MRWVVILLVLATSVAAQEGHPPIEVYSDNDWLNPATGATGGGTADDPYIIENFRIDGGLLAVAGPDAAIHVENTEAFVLFRNIIITDAFELGLDLLETSNIKFEGLTVENTRRAVHIQESSNIALEDVDIGNVGPDETAAGIWIHKTSDITMENIVLLEGSGPGLVVSSSRALAMTGIQVQGFDGGVRVQSVADALLLGVEAHANRGDGVAAANVTRLTMLDVEATRQTSVGGAFSGRGIVVLESSGSLRDIVANNNAAQGAKIATSDVNLRQGRFLDNGQAGLQVSTPAFWLQDVEAHGNGRNGIEIFRPEILPRATLDALHVHNNGGAGLLIQGIDGIHLTRLRTEANGVGLDVRASANVTLLNSYVLNNEDDGVRYNAVTGGQIVNTRATGNGGNGIMLAASQGLLIRNNTVSDNGEVGFWLDGTGYRLELNTANDNTDGAYRLTPETVAEFRGNGFDDNPPGNDSPGIVAFLPLLLALLMRRHQVA